MTKHTVTISELNEFLTDEKSKWIRFAGSYSANAESQKTLEVSFEGTYRVTDHGKVLYVGGNMKRAVNEYNDAP